MSHRSAMDRIYRYQRYFYDVTRPLFLPGRNALLERMRLGPGDRVLEMGCGTARNLIYLAKRHPKVQLYGADASSMMLDTAARNIGRAGLEERITVRLENAEDVEPLRTFGFDGSFDCVFFSYSLTMMTTWRAALDAARAALGSSERIYAVDFRDLRGWPGPAAAALRRWLSLFHVRYPEGLCEEIAERFPGVSFESIWGDYAFLASPALGDGARD